MLRSRLLLHPAERYPADPRAIFILALSAFSGIAGLIIQQAPGSVEAVVPMWGVIIWSLGLGIGSALALLGLSRDTINGIITEQIGSVMVGAATIFYSGVALWVVGVSAGQPVMIILGWGIACMIRWWQLQLLLRKMARAKLHLDAEKMATEMMTDSRARAEDLKS